MEGYQNFAQNYDPNLVANDTASVIQFVVVRDISGSTQPFNAILNRISEELFLKELKKSHRKDEIFVKAINFDDKIVHVSGFQPILNLLDNYFDAQANGMTALYKAVSEAFTHVAKYREDLELQGVAVKTCIFILTDGEDNASSALNSAACRNFVSSLRTNEKWVNSFNISVLGVGNKSIFESACVAMGLNPATCLMTIDALSPNPTQQEMDDFVKKLRAQIGVVSASISNSSTNLTVNF